MDPFTLTIVCAIGAGVGALLLSEFTGLPSIVYLLILGAALGVSGAGLVTPDALGEQLSLAVRLAVAVILFEGGLSLEFKRLRETATGSIRNLLTVGALVTWLGATVVVRLLVGLSWPVSLLYGSIVTVTGPTVIGPLLRRVRVRPRVSHILQWEGVLIDPIGAVLTLLLLEYFLTRERTAAESLMSFGIVFFSGVVVGIVVGLITGFLLRRWLARLIEEEHSGDLLALAAALVAFGLGENFAHEAGIVAATTVGFVLGNLHFDGKDELKRFSDQVSRLTVALLFVILSAGIDLHQVAEAGAPLLLATAAVAWIVRPLNVFVSTLGSELSLREKLFLSWICPRGIVAASIASLLAVTLTPEEYPGIEYIEPLIFLLITSTVVVQGLTAGWVARQLGVEERERRGVLIVGAHSFGIALGKALRGVGVPVVMIDSNLSNCIQARLEGLYAAKGNALDPTVLERAVALEVGKVLALTPNDEVNALICLAAKPFVGAGGLWRVVNDPESFGADTTGRGTRDTGKVAFAKNTDVRKIWEQIESGAWTVATYTVETEFKPEESIGPELTAPFPLFEISDGKVEILAPGVELTPGAETVALLATTIRPDA